MFRRILRMLLNHPTVKAELRKAVGMPTAEEFQQLSEDFHAQTREMKRGMNRPIPPLIRY